MSADDDRRGSDDGRDEIVASCFRNVSALVRDSPPEAGNPVSDSTRLRLYGYYKCATSTPARSSSRDVSRPSVFDPVGRAKHDAWARCEGECGGDVRAAMRRYVEVAGSQGQTAVGRRCGEMLREMLEEIERPEEGGERDEEGKDENAEEAEAEEVDGRVDRGREKSENEEANLGADSREIARESGVVGGSVVGHSTQSTASIVRTQPQSRFRAMKSLLDSVLPSPLLPRGQLDISVLDLLHALSSCIQHCIYAGLVGHGSPFHRTLSLLLPKFIMAFVDVVLSKCHPRQRARRYEADIEGRWLDMAAGEEGRAGGAAGDAGSSEEVVAGLSVRSLLDLYLSATSHPAGSEVIVVPPVNIPGMVDVMRHHDLAPVPVDLPGASSGSEAAKGSTREDSSRDSAGNDDGVCEAPDSGAVEETDDCANASVTEEENLYESTRWGIDPAAVSAAITERTVAILVVHPFGTIIANSSTMKDLRMIANEHKLDVWEDCAQCYTGGGLTSPSPGLPSRVGARNDTSRAYGTSNQLGYTGSEYADVSLFSFGPIKTATALGGGLAHLRNASQTGRGDGDVDDDVGDARRTEEVASAMRRIQDTLYEPQTNLSYLARVVRCFVVHLASRSRLLCGLVKAAVEKVGLDYDAFVVSSLRGFAVSPAVSSVDDNNGGKGTRHARSSTGANSRRELIRQLRRRPCMAMLSLLRRRLLRSEETRRSATERASGCREFANRLLSDARTERIALPRNVDGEARMHGWLFPILVSDPRRTSGELLRMGFDVPRGTSQLKPVAVDGDGADGLCPRARDFFDHVLYLPVPSSNFSAKDQTKLIEALAEATSQPPYAKECGSEGRIASNGSQVGWKRHRRPTSLRWGIVSSICSIEWHFSILGLFDIVPVRIMLRLVILAGPWIGAAAGLAVLFILALTRYMGPIYLESSSTFAKYCDMVFRSPFRQQPGAESTEDGFLQSKTVLELESTKVPTVRFPSGNKDGEPRMVLLTGATGFIGSLLLRELLSHRHSLSIPGGVIVIVRPKRGKAAKERIDRLLSQSMFEFLSSEEKSSLVRVVEGDITLPNCGLSEKQIQSLCESNISHVFHCAAAVSFSQSLEEAAMSNITSSLQLFQMTQRLNRTRNDGCKTKFVYTSTAFVHGRNTGTPSEPLGEELFPLDPYDPAELYRSMLGSQSYASAAMARLGFPNTYTFSKCVCEHLLLLRSIEGDCVIVRPSIVGPAVREPREGWAGERPSTIVAAACLYLKFPYNMWCFGRETVPFVPVDVVCRFVISKSFGGRSGRGSSRGDVVEPGVESFSEEDEKKDDTSASEIADERMCVVSDNTAIVTIAWDAASPATCSFSWLSYAFSITHLGAVCGHVNRVVAYAGLLLSTELFPWLDLRPETYERLHQALVRAPLDALLHLIDRLPPWTKPGVVRDLKALTSIIDLPLLFFPFANQNFYFKSSLVAPPDFNGERYMFSCAVAAHRFIQMIEKRRRKLGPGRHHHESNLREYGIESSVHEGNFECIDNSSIVVAGANHLKPTSDVWWALTQPRGNLAIRLGGWILAKIFRRTATEVEIDVASFRALSRATSGVAPRVVVIAPTHRSFYDFLIVSYVCFSLPELGLGIPHIAAASDFASVPVVGWLARRSRAFFLKRGGGGGGGGDGSARKNGRDLMVSLTKIMAEEKEGPAFVEVFIEGKRSRNRTFVNPKTGFLRSLAEITAEGQHNLIIPLTINYEGLPDQASLMKEANYGRGEKMSLAKLMNWIYSVFAGNVNIGRVYVSASENMVMPNSNNDQDIQGLASAIQSRHQSRVVVSDYHIKAASSVLELSEKVVAAALSELGCQIWPESFDKNGRAFPQVMPEDDRDLLWAGMLQFGHLFGPFIATSHPMWSLWLSPSFERSEAKVTQNNKAVNTILLKLIDQFELAEKAVDEVLGNLQSKGFHAPDEKHIIQYLPADAQVPMFLMQVAVKMKDTTVGVSHKLPNTAQHAKPFFTSGGASADEAQLRNNSNFEAIGAWGYQDSRFVLSIKPNGSKYAVMKGDRYAISGKPLTGLANFVEQELDVVINPNDLAFPACGDLRSVPETDLASESVADLLNLLGRDESRISLRRADRARHGTGHAQEDVYDLRTGRIRFRLPDAVVWPQNVGEVQALVSLASKKDWCLIPFGGGTNVTHSTRCPKKAIDSRPMISVDMKLMSRVLWVNEEDGLAHVEAGITGLELIQHMEKLGFTIGHEPDSYEFSTLGGWIATKASGMKQNKYGNIEDIVREVNVVGAKGLISHKHRMEKTSVGRSSIGVDLKWLMLGSEGCFGIIASAVLKIWPIAEFRSHESVLLPDFCAGLRYVKDLSKMRALKPASVRLLDNDQFRLGQALRESPSKLQSFRNFISKRIFPARSVVCATIAFEGTPEEVKVQKKTVLHLASVHGGILAGSKVGKAGYDLTFAIAYLRDFALNHNILGESFETFVPWSKLTRVIEAAKCKIRSEHERLALPGAPFVCCRITQLYDDGVCVYFYFCMDIGGVPEPSDVFSGIERSARQEILDNGGSLSHHHGLGKLRSPFVRQIYSQGHVESVVAIKEALDPINVFGARNGLFSI